MQKKIILLKLLEFFILTILILLFSLEFLSWTVDLLPQRPEWIDHWFSCYKLENQITRIFGENPGGIWEGKILYPFNKSGILFDEPIWGTSLLIAPFWLVTKNIFFLASLIGVIALFLSWVFTYYLAKALGASKIFSFYSSALFCLSCIHLSLVPLHFAFWPFFLVVILGLITIKLFSSPKISWGILWGFILGYLSWSSEHLVMMGGLFALLIMLWHLAYRPWTKATLKVLFIALAVASVIAIPVLGSIYLTYQKFNFCRGYQEPFLYASNWAGLIYKTWPDVPFNPLIWTPFWEYLRVAAKGETKIGLSIVLMLTAASLFVIRLKTSKTVAEHSKHPKRALVLALGISALLAFLNMRALLAKSIKWDGTVPDLAVGTTYACYIIAGLIIYFLRRRIKAALKHLDFFLLLCALLFGFLAFGPYYLIKGGRVIAAPVAFLQYHVPGFSGIQATARWGLIMAFALSLAVAVFLSRYLKTAKQKIFAGALMFIALLEVSPGFRLPDFKHYAVYQWSPRPTDIFLKNLPGQGAVLEMRSYPVERKQQVTSDNDLGYVLFSSLYHKKPLVTGYSSYTPHTINEFVFYPSDTKISHKTCANLRKFGAQYWVVHIEGWPQEEVQTLTRILTDIKFKKLTELDNGQTLIYEDPEPKVSLEI